MDFAQDLVTQFACGFEAGMAFYFVAALLSFSLRWQQVSAPVASGETSDEISALVERIQAVIQAPVESDIEPELAIAGQLAQLADSFGLQDQGAVEGSGSKPSNDTSQTRQDSCKAMSIAPRSHASPPRQPSAKRSKQGTQRKS